MICHPSITFSNTTWELEIFKHNFLLSFFSVYLTSLLQHNIFLVVVIFKTYSDKSCHLWQLWRKIMKILLESTPPNSSLTSTKSFFPLTPTALAPLGRNKEYLCPGSFSRLLSSPIMNSIGQSFSLVWSSRASALVLKDLSLLLESTKSWVAWIFLNVRISFFLVVEKLLQ